MHDPHDEVHDDDDALTCADAARVVTGIGPEITPNGIRMAAERGRLRVARRTRGGIRLFRLADVEHYAHERRTSGERGRVPQWQVKRNPMLAEQRSNDGSGAADMPENTSSITGNDVQAQRKHRR